MSDNELDILDGWGGDDDLDLDMDDNLDDFNNDDNNNNMDNNNNNIEEDIEEKLDIQQHYNHHSLKNNQQLQKSSKLKVVGDEIDGMKDQQQQINKVEGLISKLSSFVSQETTTTTSDHKNNSNNNSNNNDDIDIDDDLFFDNDGWDWNDNNNDDDDNNDSGQNNDENDVNNQNDQMNDDDIEVGGNKFKSNDDNGDNEQVVISEPLKFIPYTQIQQTQSNISQTPPQQQPSLSKSPHEQQLLEYIQYIYSPSTPSIINQNLLTPSSTPAKALELCRYYHSRPQLTEYTIDIEIPRIKDYQIVMSDELVLVGFEEIQLYFHQHKIENLVEDMLLRASNQSLFADIFPLVTSSSESPDSADDDGSYCLVRNDFYATMIATKCRFVLDMRKDDQIMTQGECTFILSIPWNDAKRYYDHNNKNENDNETQSSSSSKNKLDLAQIRFMIQFSPEPHAPSIQYQLVSIVPLLDLNNDHDLEKIHYASISLEEMKLSSSLSSIHDTGMFSGDGGDSSTDRIRDNFIQSIMSETQTGFKSALQDIDGVVNVSSKLNFLKNVVKDAGAGVLPILPSAEEIIAASDVNVGGGGEEEGGVGERDIGGSGGFVHHEHRENEFQHPQQHHHHHNMQKQAPPPPPQEQQQQSKVGRPIIGGLLLSGISQLAEAVTVPSSVEEEIHAMNQNNNDSPLKLYRKDSNDNEHGDGGRSNNRQGLDGIDGWKKDDSRDGNHIPQPHGLHNDNHLQKEQHQRNTVNMQSGVVANNDIRTNNQVVEIIDNDNDIDEDDDGWDEDDDLDLDFNDEEEVQNPIIEHDTNDNIIVKDLTISNNTKEEQSPDIPKNDTKQAMELTQEKQTVELTPRQKKMVATMETIRKLRLDINDAVPDGFVFDEVTGILPTRKRFIPRSKIFADLIEGV